MNSNDGLYSTLCDLFSLLLWGCSRGALGEPPSKVPVNVRLQNPRASRVPHVPVSLSSFLQEGQSAPRVDQQSTTRSSLLLSYFAPSPIVVVPLLLRR